MTNNKQGHNNNNNKNNNNSNKIISFRTETKYDMISNNKQGYNNNNNNKNNNNIINYKIISFRSLRLKFIDHK